GFKKDDIQIDVDNGILTISAERNEETEDQDKKGRYIRRERRMTGSDGWNSATFLAGLMSRTGMSTNFPKYRL
ncbi:MAG: Hsp20 family protein, partial [Eubacterium sp.]|nr:Hsp20 family protein [Eubacterium sp.]